MTSKQERVIDPCTLACSNSKITNFRFLKEKEFLIQYVDSYEKLLKEKEELEKKRNKLPEELYLRLLKTLREKIFNYIALLKESKYKKKKNNKILKMKEKLHSNEKKKEFDQKNEDLNESFSFFKGQFEINEYNSIEGYLDKKLYKTEFALGFNFFETNYEALEVITKFNTRQSDIFMKLSNIFTVILIRMSNYIILK